MTVERVATPPRPEAIKAATARPPHACTYTSSSYCFCDRWQGRSKRRHDRNNSVSVNIKGGKPRQQARLPPTKVSCVHGDTRHAHLGTYFDFVRASLSGFTWLVVTRLSCMLDRHSIVSLTTFSYILQDQPRPCHAGIYSTPRHVRDQLL